MNSQAYQFIYFIKYSLNWTPPTGPKPLSSIYRLHFDTTNTNCYIIASSHASQQCVATKIIEITEEKKNGGQRKKHLENNPNEFCKCSRISAVTRNPCACPIPLSNKNPRQKKTHKKGHSSQRGAEKYPFSGRGIVKRMRKDACDEFVTDVSLRFAIVSRFFNSADESPSGWETVTERMRCLWFFVLERESNFGCWVIWETRSLIAVNIVSVIVKLQVKSEEKRFEEFQIAIFCWTIRINQFI